MPPLSLKKIFTVIAILFLLAYSRIILEYVAGLWTWFDESLDPLRNSPIEVRYFATLVIMAFLFFVLYRLMDQRK